MHEMSEQATNLSLNSHDTLLGHCAHRDDVDALAAVLLEDGLVFLRELVQADKINLVDHDDKRLSDATE